MAYRVIFEKEAAFIRKHRLTMSMKDMARELGVSDTAVRGYLKKNDLLPPRSLGRKFASQKLKGRSVMTPEQDRILKEKYLEIAVKPLADLIGVSDTCLRTRIRQLGLVIPPELIEQRKRDSRLKPGNVPPNKGMGMDAKTREKVKHTWFKKGGLPGNTLHDGAITIRNGKDSPNSHNPPYKYIRLGKAKWVPLHRHIWEQAHGKVPKGQLVAFKDGDSMNCELDNLELITKEQNMLRNSIAVVPQEYRETVKLTRQLQKAIIAKKSRK